MKKILVALPIALISGLFIYTFAFAHSNNLNQCNANNPENCPNPSVVCDNGEHIGNPHCVTPTPTLTPTETPSCTPTPTETVSVTPTITPTPTLSECEGDDCNTVTPTPTVEETPEVTPTPDDNGGNNGGQSSVSTASYNAPTCNGILPDKPLLQGFKANGKGSVTFSWWPVDTDKYSIRYGYSLDALNMGVPSIPNTSTSITLDGLQEGQNVWAVLTAYKGECAIDSTPLDPKVK